MPGHPSLNQPLLAAIRFGIVSPESRGSSGSSQCSHPESRTPAKVTRQDVFRFEMSTVDQVKTGQEEIRALTSIRFLAALWVFVFHAHSRWPLAITPGGGLDNFIRQGARGVSLFFVLSGFILALTYAGRLQPDLRSPEVRRFLVKRFARVYPVYLWGFILCLPWLFRIGLANGLIDAVVLGVLNAAALNAWFPSIGMDWYGNGGWSVCVELFFYVCFPFVSAGFARMREPAIWGAALVGVMLSGALGLLPLTGLSYAVSYSWPPSRLPEFLVGVCAGLIARRVGPRLVVVVWPLAILLAIGCLSAWTQPSIAQGALQTAVSVLGFALMLIGLTMRSPRLLEGRIGNALGQASYSFYVTQIPLLFLVGSIEKRFPFTAGLSSWVVVVLLFVANLALALLSWRGIEVPFRLRILDWYRRREVARLHLDPKDPRTPAE